jgi:putative beta-lysine N-acetyltransferase
MAALYRLVFTSYPFPVHDPEYLADSMSHSRIFAGIWGYGDLLALASATIDGIGSNAELSGFATRPDVQGRGLAKHLLRSLEHEICKAGIGTTFCVARAPLYGMNIICAQQGYQHGGTLVKDAKYSGGLESMNVWYKYLRSECL